MNDKTDSENWPRTPANDNAGAARRDSGIDVTALRAALANQQAAFRQLMLSPYLTDNVQARRRGDAISAHRRAMEAALALLDDA